MAILRDADLDPIAAVAKRHSISEQTIYPWRKRFGTFQADDVRRLKQLGAENARLRELATQYPRYAYWRCASFSAATAAR